MARLVSRFGLTRYEADEYYRIALDFYKKNNLKEAVENIELAINLNPSRAEYYAARGLFRMADDEMLAGAQTRANLEADFTEALKRNPYEMLANYGLGMLQFKLENYKVAYDYFIKAWTVQQERPETMYYLSLTTHRLKNNEHALGWMKLFVEKMEAIDPNNSDLKKGDINKRIRQGNQWIKTFEKLLAKQAKMNQSVTINPDR